MQEEKAHNLEPPTTTTTTQLEASHYMITQGIVAIVEKATTAANITEAEEDTPLFRRKLKRVLEVGFIAAATKKERSLLPL